MSHHDVYGIGNALLDIEFEVDDAFLVDNDIAKGHMTLVDERRMHDILSQLGEGPTLRRSGGSAANTLVAVQAFGGSAFYSCRVADDEVGRFFLGDLNALGIATNYSRVGAPSNGDAHSGRCISLVTRDAERSMNTFLGISESLDPADVVPEALAQSRCLYIEGYLCSSDSGRAAAVRAREIAQEENVRTSMTLSDPAMVEFFRDQLVEMLGNGIDHLFCNEEEALTWAKTDRLDIAERELQDIAPTLNITLGSRGSLAIDHKQRTHVAGFETRAVDTTGAGDMYAGACLHALAQDAEAPAAARFANYCAAANVGQFGARLQSLGEYQNLLAKYVP